MDALSLGLQNLEKDFIFLTEVKGSVYLYNISRMTRNNFNFNWSNKRLPNSTEFNKTAMIEKLVGFLPIKDSKQIQI